MSQTELLPCPFCGGPNIEQHADEVIECCDCGATAQDDLIWNRRSSSLLLDKEEAGGQTADKANVGSSDLTAESLAEAAHTHTFQTMGECAEMCGSCGKVQARQSEGQP